MFTPPDVTVTIRPRQSPRAVRTAGPAAAYHPADENPAVQADTPGRQYQLAWPANETRPLGVAGRVADAWVEITRRVG